MIVKITYLKNFSRITEAHMNNYNSCAFLKQPKIDRFGTRNLIYLQKND